jgi:hypothetical protein
MSIGLKNDHQDDDEKDQSAKSDVHSRSSDQTINDFGAIGSRG